MRGNLIVGSSHALGLARAVGDFPATADEAKDRLLPIGTADGRPVSLLYTRPTKGFVRLESDGGQGIRATFDPPIDQFRAFNHPEAKVVFMLGGHEPAGRFFYRDPKPFDFVHPEVAHTDPRRQIIPLAHMRQVMADLLGRTGLVTEALAREVPQARRYYVAAPPPIPSDEHIRQFPEIFEFDKYGVEDRFVRLKLYRLQMDHMRAFCARTGIEFVAAPTANLDETGFLKEAYWEGCTHASVDYYREVVETLAL